MSIEIIKNTLATIPHLVRLGFLAALVIFLSFLFPSKLSFNYDFERGGRWKYEDLKAPFSFPVQKTATEVEEEKQEIDAQFVPYYRWDKEVSELQQQQFVDNFNYQLPIYLQSDSSMTLDSTEYVQFGLGVLEHIYNKRLIKLKEEHREKGDDLVFHLLDGNMDLGEYSPQSDLLTHKEAMQFLVDTLHAVEDELEEYKFIFSILENVLEVPNVVFDSVVTNKSKADAVNNISPYRGMVEVGELMVTRDQLIDSVTYTKLQSYQKKYKEEINQHKNSFVIYFGYLALTIALIGIFAFFVLFYAPEVFKNLRHFGLILLMIGGYAYLAHVIDSVYILDLYLIPFCIIPIIILNFFSPQLALFTHVIIILLVAMLLSLDYQFILIQILVGMVTVVSKLKTRRLSDYFISLLYIGLAYALVFLSLEIIQTGSFMSIYSEKGTLIEEGVRWSTLGWISLNVFLTLLSYPLIPLLEKFFGLTSDITLVELSDMDNPLLKELSFKAPGTLQHSLQVANLSEAAAKAIGAKALLVKVASLYHDIGKMANPQYFIENQNTNNPHEALNHLESAEMIISHVTEGEKMARKDRLPKVLIDFIRTHHGTTRVEYFYRMYKKENPDKEVNEALFRYPGPKPFTKEHAIMMIADSLEAASKSLKNPSEQDINDLVDNIIKGKITLGQLENTNLSFRELEEIKLVFKKLLKSINHVRIEYPNSQPIKTKPPKED